jgi:hypothetical protein
LTPKIATLILRKMFPFISISAEIKQNFIKKIKSEIIHKEIMI